jgi:hypothetical protein
MSATPTTTTELLARIDAGWAEISAYVAGLDERQLMTSGADGWSVADHLGHLAAWECSIISLLRGQPRHEGLGVPESAYLTGHDVVNALIQARTHAQPVATILTDWRTTHATLRSMIVDLADADLQRSYASYLPNEPGRRGQQPIVDRIIGNTYEHYAEHLPWMRRLLDTPG